jgi:hypothetical protein
LRFTIVLPFISQIIVLALVMAWACRKPQEEAEEEEEVVHDNAGPAVDASQIKLQPDEEPEEFFLARTGQYLEPDNVYLHHKHA